MKFNLNISQRISVGYIVIIFIAAIAAIGSIITFETNKSKYKEISDIYLPSVSYLKDFKNMVNDSRKYTNDWIYQPNDEEKAKLKNLQDRDYPELRTKIQSLGKNSGTNKNQFEDLIKSFDSLILYQKTIMKTLSGFDSYSDDVLVDKAMTVFDKNIKQQVKKFNDDLDRILVKENELLRNNESQLKASYDYLTYVMIGLLAIVFIVGFFASRMTSRIISKPLNTLKTSIVQLGRGEIPEVQNIDRKDEIGEMNNAIVAMKDSIRLKTEFAYETGKGNYEKQFELLSDKDILGLALIEMNENLKENGIEESNRRWINTGVSELNEIFRANQGDKLYSNVVSFLVNYLQVNVGGLFVVNENTKGISSSLRLVSGYAFDKKVLEKKIIDFGEGFVGQVALEKKTIITKNLPDDYLKIGSGFGESKPRQLMVIPLLFENEMNGVLEFALFMELSALQIEFIETCSRIIGSALDLIVRKERTEKLLKESQDLNVRMQEQEEELKVNNEELMEKTNLLQMSEEELKVQQEELLQTNTQLEEKAQLLAQQNEAIKIKNEELEVAREAIRVKAEELELTSKYKSEFLANMSHELRTPLNSVLILANLLAENKEKNLNEKQTEYARVINKSGSDLLELINDILDLSKIESRKIELEVTEFPFTELAYDLESLFKEVAVKKKINFSVNIASDLPEHFISDKLRMEQIIKNLLSNAFKFTSADGSISLNIYRASSNRLFRTANLEKSNDNVCFEVKDSGIGIPKDKQQIIFEAFQQADGSTNRRFGGTGLGLSISRELSFILGGEIQVESTPGVGSTFTLILPNNFLKINSDQEQIHVRNTHLSSKSDTIATNEKIKPELIDNVDTNIRSNEEMLILIIEDDDSLAKILLEHAKEKGFKGIIADRGDIGLELAIKHKPDAIMLDINLPVMDGWTIMRKLKENPQLKKIPVHIITGNDNEKLGMQLGAVEFLKKPISNEQLKNMFDKIKDETFKPLQKVLIIEDNKVQNDSVIALLENQNLDCTPAESGEEAIKLLNANFFDLIILDLSLPDISGFDILKQIRKNESWKNIPVIIYTGKNLSVKENKLLSEFSNAVILKTSSSPERLIDETTLFLKKLEKGNLVSIETSKINILPQLEELLKGKKVLLVDDDMRNIFALSKFLERFDLNIIVANDGKEALLRLSENPDINIVLMDIMMPEMDGYEAMQKIREQRAYKDLPIIALTAKAMKGDREKCIEAGASDYVSKPIDTQQLVSLMRVWLSK